MRFAETLVEGVLLARRQRFLADVRLAGGKEVVAHVPNSGRLTGLAVPGHRCFLSRASGKLPYRLELIEAQGILVGVNTWRAAALAEEALLSGLLPLPGCLPPFSLRREVRVGANSRLDLLLEDAQGPYWVEVKNITLVQEGVGLFPDAVTARGSKHLRLLAQLVAAGLRAAVVYVVQRDDAQRVRAAAEIDPAYARQVAQAAAVGVRFAAVGCQVSRDAVTPCCLLPVDVAAEIS